MQMVYKPGERLEALDTSVVALPLLEMMRSESGKIRVIIDINMFNKLGRHDTREEVADLVEDISSGSVITGLGTDTDQFVFASLTSEEIRDLARANERLRSNEQDHDTCHDRLIYKIWPDFEGELLVNESVSTVKADAALAAFAAGGRGIVWAVIDTGIDGGHPHFEKHKNLQLKQPLSHMDFSGAAPQKVSPANLVDLNGHGTHMAGIIAGEIDAPVKARLHFLDENRRHVSSQVQTIEGIRGIAPHCKLVSLRVVGDDGKLWTSSIIAALGYIRRINGDGRLPRIHGVNISLGHEFHHEWFACGQSPLCIEVDRLVKSGTTAVVAAGNGGMAKVFSAEKGGKVNAFVSTLRDPANAREAITVGSTHRDMPHVYGVSYFSSKGPTGDGRMKPDLLAPGEKIISCAANSLNDECLYKELSGTSQAAAHVSGCVAAFLSIRREFKTRPDRVKEILMETATDLGRERYFQGRGLVDLMRAIQSV